MNTTETIYKDTAYDIIRSAIKSAVFIDENARDFFTERDELSGSDEERISADLYENFKKDGISLDVHKFNTDDDTNQELKDFFFEDRDLILLDWHLDDQGGEELSLSLLADIVEREHIHFCIIYTSDSNKELDNILSNVLSFFSGYTKEFHEEKRLLLEDIENITTIQDKLNYINLNRESKDAGRAIGELYKTNHEAINEIKKIFDTTDNKCALINAAISLNDTIKSEAANPCPSIISPENKTLVINNTIISILNKDANKPKELLNKLSDQILNQDSSFTQLLGLEMKSLLAKHSSFIDESVLKVSEKAFIHHRSKFIEEGTEHFFSEFVKNIFLEKINLNLRNKNLKLLDKVLLDSFGEIKNIDDSELIAMNTFYNSTILKSDNKVSFGDVFEILDKNEYYICITALCDCLRHEGKIDNKFFFAKGSNISKEDALKLGDSAFLSFLDNTPKIVKWSEVITSIKQEYHKYSPVYIKPIQFTVVDPEFDDNNNVEISYLNSKGELEREKMKYLTTIKENYTQRIANHAFGYPVRVGVDFVKK